MRYLIDIFMKKIVCFLLCLVLTLPVLVSCSDKAPTVDEIYDRVSELCEASQELNEIFWGEGLPTYPHVESLTDKPLEYDEKLNVYYLLFEDENGRDMCMYYHDGEYMYLSSEGEGEVVFTDPNSGVAYYHTDYVPDEPEYVYEESEPDDYDVVRPESKYLSIDEIKAAAEKVFSKSYLNVIYQSAFDGVAFVEGATSGVRGARFIEHDLLLRQRNDIVPRISAKRIFDYSTMKIIKPSNAERINLTMDSHLEGSDEILNVRLSLVIGPDGLWYLDSPTY